VDIVVIELDDGWDYKKIETYRSVLFMSMKVVR